MIERGAKANGDYVRFADGTQICTSTQSASTAIRTGYLGCFRSAAQPWVFPASFAPGTDISLTGSALNGTSMGVVFQGTTSANQTGWNATAITTQSAAIRSVSLSATGRGF